jgi:ring-1,2-phenylacetyl-CoA epoxidase subunit PaaC
MGIEIISLKNEWDKKVKEVMEQATLPVPENVFMLTGGKTGTHTEHLGFLLAELQYMQRAYPDSQW